jgi:hypothetical protein
MGQLPLFNNQKDDSYLHSKYESRLSRFLNRNKSNSSGSITIIKPGGTARGEQGYFYYRYYVGSRQKTCYIPGGNCYSLLALERARLVLFCQSRKILIISLILKLLYRLRSRLYFLIRIRNFSQFGQLGS